MGIFCSFIKDNLSFALSVILNSIKALYLENFGVTSNPFLKKFVE
jgi:hypothetical protein